MAEAELLVQLNKNNMVKFLSIGDTFNATKIPEAAMKMTKANMTLLRSQVCSRKVQKESIDKMMLCSGGRNGGPQEAEPRYPGEAPLNFGHCH